jgi:pimeloyl-ACP methyl ester carboxylesterase
MVKQFSLRGMLMTFITTRFTVNSFMRWAGFSDRAGEHDARPVLDLMYLGVKHFRMPHETLRVAANAANPLSDDELTSMHMPVLLLMGDREVIYDAAEALARARRLIPDFEGAIVPGCRHDMCFSQHRLVPFLSFSDTPNEAIMPRGMIDDQTKAPKVHG